MAQVTSCVKERNFYLPVRTQLVISQTYKEKAILLIQIKAIEERKEKTVYSCRLEISLRFGAVMKLHRK